MKTYNGWSNYATWLVNQEILGDIDFKESVTADDLKDIVEDCVFRNTSYYLVEDFARAFLSEVNYNEIAKLINEEL